METKNYKHSGLRKMWIYSLPRSNARRRGLPALAEVEVSVGRKYISIKTGSLFCGRFFGDLREDDNGLLCYVHDGGNYSSEYLLFESQKDAETRKRCDEVIEKILHSKTFGRALREWPLPLLEQVLNFLTEDFVAGDNDLVVRIGDKQLWIPKVFIPELTQMLTKSEVYAETDLSDLPKTCGECPYFCYTASDFGTCPLAGEDMASDELEYRSGGCPLRRP